MTGGQAKDDQAAGSPLIRAIDIPIEELEVIDEHAIGVAAEQADTWAALIPVLQETFGGPLPRRIADMLGCDQTETGGDPRHPGATLAGFVVARSVPPTLYALLGSHRFSRYALVFHVDPSGAGRSRVRAETRAEFPGAGGRAYRAAVIGTRAHVLAVRRLLRAVKRRAERGGEPGRH